jgi:hypothetical protein
MPQRRGHPGEVLHAALPLLRPDPADVGRDAEPLAFINDGYLQHMRVDADGGIGVK